MYLTLDKEATELLKEVGRWFKVNGEAIYGTRPWYMFGEGKNRIGAHDLESTLTVRDFRYTTKNGYLYAFVMDWPKRHQNPIVLPNLTEMNQRISNVISVELIGHDEDLEWENHGDGLHVTLPSKKPCDHAYALKIGFAEPIKSPLQ